MEAESRGWLREPYRLFHSTDRRNMDFEAHFHEFHKIVFCLKGSVTYAVEGTVFRLERGDLLVIPAHCIHRSSFGADNPYERVILWIAADYPAKFGEPMLEKIFRETRFFRADGFSWSMLEERLRDAERALKATTPGHKLLAETYLVQFLLAMGELAGGAVWDGQPGVRSDRSLNELLTYIGGHLSENMTAQSLAERFGLEEKSLGRRFRAYVGCPLHQYIVQKRMIGAAEEIRGGAPVLKAAKHAGYKDYSAFLKAFRKAYGCAPGELKSRENVR